MSLSLDDGKWSGYRPIGESNNKADLGYQGTTLWLLPPQNYTYNLAQYFSNGELEFFLWECSGHINMCKDLEVIFSFNNDYYYKYHSWKTSDTNYGSVFVEKGTYYQGLIPSN